MTLTRGLVVTHGPQAHTLRCERGLAWREVVYNRFSMCALKRLVWAAGWLAGFAAGPGVATGAVPGGSIAVTSDYVLRGVSQSDGRPALQGEAHWSFAPGWSSGFWASQVRLAPAHESAEIGSYLQWRGALSEDFDLSASAAHYSYANDPRPIRYSYNELGVSLSWRDQLYVAASWTPKLNLYSYIDGLAGDRQVLTLEASLHRNLRPRLDLTAGIGLYYPKDLDYASYAYGNAALAWHYGHWHADLGWFWVQNAAHRRYSSGRAGGPLAANLRWSF